MIEEEAARDLLTVADVSLAAASRHIADIDDDDAQVAVQRLFDVVNTHQLLLQGHIEAHPG